MAINRGGRVGWLSTSECYADGPRGRAGELGPVRPEDLHCNNAEVSANGPSQPDLQPDQEPYPGEERLGGPWTAVVIGLLALVLILVFILQNLQSVELSFLIFHGHLPVAIALLFAVILGATIVLAFGGARIMQLRMVARASRRRGVKTSPPTG
jgi:uncharacterized integral membrane protein